MEAPIEHRRLRGIDQHPDEGPRQDQRGPGKDHETAETGDRNDVGQDRRWQKRRGHHPDERRHKRRGRGGRREDQRPSPARGPQPPEQRRHHDRRPHDVEDVDPQQVGRPVRPSEDPRLEPEEEGQPEDLEPTPDHGVCRPTEAAGPAQVRSRGQRDRDAGEEEEQRGAPAADDHQHAEGGALAIGRGGPTVEQVSLDHQQHGDAAQPVEMFATPWRLAGSDAHPRPY